MIQILNDNDTLHPTYTVVRDGALGMELTDVEAVELIAALVGRITDPQVNRNHDALTARFTALIDPMIRNGVEAASGTDALRGTPIHESTRIAAHVVGALRTLDR